MGEMSAARTTMPGGDGEEEEEDEGTLGDLRSALTTSLTPRLRHLLAAAVVVEGGRLAQSTEGRGGGGRKC